MRSLTGFLFTFSLIAATFGAAQTSLAAQGTPDPYDMSKAVVYTAASKRLSDQSAAGLDLASRRRIHVYFIAWYG